MGDVPEDSKDFDYIVTYVFTIINTRKTEVIGTKTWVGGSDSGIQLNLYRTTDADAAKNPSAYPNAWVLVKDAEAVWDKTGTD